MATDLSLGEAASALGVSLDTLRRWDRAGKLHTTRDERNRRRVPSAEIERLGARPRRRRSAPGDSLSARNRLPGRVRSVEVDGVMGIVELEAGPFRIVSIVTREAVDDLGLRPGMQATALVKATSVLLER